MVKTTASLQPPNNNNNNNNKKTRGLGKITSRVRKNTTPAKPASAKAVRQRPSIQQILNRLKSWDENGWSARDAATNLNTARSALQGWMKDRALYESVRPKDRSKTNKPSMKSPRYPEMEKALFVLFLNERKKRTAINLWWLQYHGEILFRKLYPHDLIVNPTTGESVCGKKHMTTLPNSNQLDFDTAFKFSRGWALRFRCRHNIVIRVGTHTAQFSPENAEKAIGGWIGFTQWLLKEKLPGLEPKHIANADQLGMHASLLSNKTYESRGAKSVAVKVSPLAKLKYTLMQCIMGDGVKRCRIVLILPRFPGMTAIQETAIKNHSPDNVVVFFQKDGYMNGDVLKEWVDSTFSNEMKAFGALSGMIAVDCFKAHLNSKEDRGKFGEALLKMGWLRTLIPAGCTGDVQPCDVAVNKILKDDIRNSEYEWSMLEPNRQALNDKTHGLFDRYLLIVEWSGQAWDRLHAKHKNMIAETFLRVGLTNNPDGSENHLIKLKKLGNVKPIPFDPRQIPSTHRQVVTLDSDNEGVGHAEELEEVDDGLLGYDFGVDIEPGFVATQQQFFFDGNEAGEVASWRLAFIL
ncbi:hypothetical protein BHYA_1019g00010 [Botrytis hyacinthi]|uniref:DDE-1 domain-containing protein n=1 Tax=Botrytis hyacinthi TaxID=278943 RepID=A0A4Z1G8N2_9HELO|nr:hypothetical protein BHYA_1019g00010 [Botrytis hyacinthi]